MLHFPALSGLGDIVVVKRRDFIQGLGIVVAGGLSAGVLVAAQERSRRAEPKPNSEPPAADLVPPSRNGLTSNANYFFYGDGRPILGPSVTLEVTQDIVAEQGFSIQWNAYSHKGAPASWLQYVIAFSATPDRRLKIHWQVEYWAGKEYHEELHEAIGLSAGGDLINHSGPLVTLPMASGTAVTVPAGLKVAFSLDCEENGDVTGISVVATDPHGKSTSSGLQQLKDFHFTRNKTKVAREAMVPVHAFQVNVVGIANSRYTYVKSGAGKIIYKASVPITVHNRHPRDISSEGTFTAETSNVIYGRLEAGPGTEFTQTFEATDKPIFRPGGAFALSHSLDAEQTDLYVTSVEGQLVMFSAKAGRRWTRVGAYGPIDMTTLHCPIAVAQRFGTDNQTGIFLVDQNEQLQVLVASPGGVTGPRSIGPEHFVPRGSPLVAVRRPNGNETDVLLFNNHEQLSLFSGSATGAWKGPVVISEEKFVPRRGQLAASTLFDTDQLALFAVHKGGGLHVFRQKSDGNWEAPERIGKGEFKPGGHITVARCAGNPRQTDVYLIDKKGQLKVFSTVWDGAWNGPVAIGPTDFASAGAPVEVITAPDGTETHVLVADKNGTLQRFSMDKEGAWSTAQQIGPSSVTRSAALIASAPQLGAQDQWDIFLINETGTNAPGWPVVFSGSGTHSWTGPKALVTEV